MLHGAYYTDDKKHQLEKSPSSNIIERDWVSICNPSGVNGNSQNRFYTGFDSIKNRQAYVEEATGEKFERENFSVNCQNTDKDKQWLSTLKYEPLFLLIKRDLLNPGEDLLNDLFDRLENQHPTLLPKGSKSQEIDGYYARLYPATQNAIGVKDGVLFGYGPAVDWKLTNFGSAEDMLNRF